MSENRPRTRKSKLETINADENLEFSPKKVLEEDRKAEIEKTPYTLRTRIKKNIRREQLTKDRDDESSSSASSEDDDSKPKIKVPIKSPNKFSKPNNHKIETINADENLELSSKKALEENRKAMIEKTPYTLRTRIKKNITRVQLTSDEDFSDSGSEYTDSQDESESSASSNSSENDDPQPEMEVPIKFTKNFNKPNNHLKNARYYMKTDDFFSNNSSAKSSITSNNTLDKLETPRLPQDQLQKLLKNMKLSNQHGKSLNNLNDLNTNFFDKWLYLLHENFNILLYGLGSKSNLLNQFHNEYLKDLPVIVINGFFPTLTIKDILDSIILDLLELKENSSNVYEACSLIEKELTNVNNHCYIIINNIDMIRNNKAQNIFSRLAAVDNIHLIASVDHINASLLWDHSKLSKFNFTWWDCTSFQSYINETSYESSMVIQRSGSLALSSLKNVFVSLTINSKKIFQIIVKHQLENAKNQYYQGIAFKDLYWACREAFLVSSDLVLRAQLTEFVDHKMIKLKRSGDGTEYLTVPISNTLLQQFISENAC